VSEFLASAAEKMGVPEALVKRSAEARAKAAGAATDDILAAWAGGEAAPAAATPPPAATPEPETTPEAEAPAEPSPSEPSPATPAAPAAVTASAVPGSAPVSARASVPPVLVGRHDRLVGAMAGAAALLALTVLVGFFVASTPEDSTLAYTSEFAYSEIALDGQHVYRTQGCAACHTQVVRALVADAGFGGVSMSDTNQIIGIRRLGPDLTHIGSRVETDADLYAVLDGGSGHPPYGGLGQTDLNALVAYLMESK
jgi:hypothetical protein